MSAFTTLETIATRLPHGYDHVLARSAREAAQPSLFARIAAFLAGRREREATFAALRTMTDRELADIGLSRQDIPLVFDSAFAARHETARLRRAA